MFILLGLKEDILFHMNPVTSIRAQSNYVVVITGVVGS